MTAILSIRGLTKTYASGLKALDNVDLDIAKGEIFALLGPNGAGKTTLINIACGVVTGTAGTVTADGFDTQRDYRQARGWLREAEETVRGLPADAPERVRLLNAWGTLYLVEGNAGAAQRNLAAAISRATAPADRAAALHNLAAAEMQTGNLRDAASHEREAIELAQREFGDRHRFVMKAWIGLSSIQGLQEDWRAAEQSISRAIGIAETPEALANYAIVLEKLHRGKEAKDLRRRFRLDFPTAAPLVDVKSLTAEKPIAVRSR